MHSKSSKASDSLGPQQAPGLAVGRESGRGCPGAEVHRRDGWKSALGKRLDAIIVRAVPGVRKAVKWNQPMYGIEGEGWFMAFSVLAKYVKVAFFRGASLTPRPPGESKQKNVRYLDIYEDDELDEAQFASWAKQASELPGEWRTT